MEEKIVSKKVLERFRPDIYKFDQRWIFDDSDEIEIKLSCSRSFSTFWNISGDLFTEFFYSWIRGDLIFFKSFVYIPNMETILVTRPKRFS